MPEPQPGESRDDFVSRCIPVVLDDGTAEDNDQAVAICNRTWEDADKSGGNTMEHKTFTGFVTKADEEQGIVEAFFSIFGVLDSGNDVVHPGAFTKTFAEQGLNVKIVDNHRTDTVMRLIGKPLLLKEVVREDMPTEMLEQHPGVTGGAFLRAQMLMDTPEGKGVFIRAREGVISDWSFGYDALDTDFSTIVKDGKEINARNLRTIKLYEISPVLFGMCEATTTLSAKAEDEKNVSEIMHDAGASGIWAESDLATTGVNPFGGKGASGATNLPLELDDDSIVPLQDKAIDGGEDARVFPIGDGRYILALADPVSQDQLAYIADRLGAWEKSGSKFFVLNGNARLMKIEEQTESAPPQEAAMKEHDQAQAGPDASPERLVQDENLPTSKELLDELELLKLQTQTLEVT